MSVELILMLLLITNVFVCHASTDYSYDDYEEIPDTALSTSTANPPKSTFSLILEDDDERRKMENDIIKERLDQMSSTFRKIVNKLKMKHKRVEMVFLVDSSSSVGKENFANEISFVKRLLSDFNVSFNYTRVALITFSSRSKIVVHINQVSEASMENDKCVLLNHQIPNVTYSGGGTNTYSALVKAKEIFENSKRKASKKVLVLITDGFSNGRDPIPVAQQLKENSVIIFTVGITSGNYDELRAISSKPAEYYNYMLSSFSLFESLARKALHTDYKIGVILPVSNSSFCDSLCDKNGTEGACCDSNSQCACGFHSGHYSCVCNPGYYGNGLKPNGCDFCPNGTYWNFWNSCFNCPDINHETRKSPALSIKDCVCKAGYRATQKNRCEVIKCPLLPVPENGYFVHAASCLNTVNTACGARCNSGYQLVGSSIRLCQEDGGWSNHETECVLKTCPALVIPFFGMALCKNSDLNITIDYSPRNLTFVLNYNDDVQKLTENFSIDSECEFSCAYGFYLIGSPKRHCLPLSKWDGLQANCKQILCQPLPTVPFASYNSEDCTEQKSAYGTNCSLTCDEGFEVKGPAMKTCGGTRNGVWSQKNKLPRCVDVSPPTIVCPKNYSIEISGNKSYVLLSSFEPLELVKDNSGGNVSFWVKPALKEGGTKMYSGNYTFTYVAIDDFKNKAKCNFTITIADKTPPVFENCIVNQTFYVSSKNKSEKLIEWEEPSSFDNVDDKNVTVLSNLQAGFLDPGDYIANYTAVDKSGNTASCLITITVKEKKCDDLEKPENGQRICAKNETHTWCDFRCNFGYDINSNDSLIENVVLHCENGERVWSSENIPECSKIEQPSSVLEVLTISLQSENMICEEIGQNQEQLIKELKEDLCGEQECDLTTELPECIDDSVPNEVSNASYYSLVKRDTESKPIKKAKHPAKVEIYVKISKNLHMWKPNSTKSENIKKVKEELKKVNSSERFKKRLRNMNVDLTLLKLDEMITCNPGSVAKNLLCVQCGRGTFHDKQQNACVPCQLGSFNSLTGQVACIECAEFYSTRKAGSRLQSDCRPLCPPGHIARIKTPKKNNSTGPVKTLMPFCKSCSVGEYQPEYDQISCRVCPDNKTSERGSKSIDNCYEKYEKSCEDSLCGVHGKCTPNGAFYTCECLNGYYGQNCELKQDQCSILPCFNGGNCRPLNETSVVCECPEGYNGEFCESVKDLCNQKNCQNGANCNEIEGEAICDCLPGFEGEFCDQQIQIDFCKGSPCFGDGICVNKLDDYECICKAGSIGKRCHLTACDYKPCPSNSICVNLQHDRATKESYFCKCPRGLRGENCESPINPCEGLPCRNNAECLPHQLRDPKNVTSVDDDSIFEKFSCKCPPFFYGDRCELFTTPDFLFNFEKSSINSYVKLSAPETDFNALSFCTWIQTNDVFNYGSIISYATNEIDNAFTFTDYNGFVLYVNGVNVISDIKIIDNIWHFLCVSWTMDEGHYQIYLDGTLNVEGFNLSKTVPIEGKGIFIIGQEQDSLGGGFSESESFVGKISYLDVWNRELSTIEISEYYRTCDPYQGNLYSWTDLKFKTHGSIKIQQSEFCKPCNQNLTVDNADVVYGEQTAFVKCSTGFQMVGSPFVFCLRTSKWELSKLPLCKIVKCSPLITPANGRVFLTKTSYKGQARFTCDDGFVLMGNSTITCMANGNWSDDIPHCKSLYECPALEDPSNGVLVYASDYGPILEKKESFPIGTFFEIKCDEGFYVKGENLISCSEQGTWDFEVEDCQPESNPSFEKEKIPLEFWRDFKEFLFISCNMKAASSEPELCKFYSSDFESDLSYFELPETPEFEGMDGKLSNALEILIDSSEFNSISAGDFMKRLFQDDHVSNRMRDSFRFVICLYIDLILLDHELNGEAITESDEFSSSDNINERIKKMLKKVAQPIFHQLQEKKSV